MSTQKLHLTELAYDASDNELKSASAAALAAGTGYFTKFISDIVRLRAFRRAEKELSALDDRMLKDIGLDRTEIRSALMNAHRERRNGWRMPQPPGY